MNHVSEIKFIAKTDYFNKKRTWIVRGVQFLIAISVLYLVDLQELQNGTHLLYIFGPILALGFIIVPTDELGLDNDRLYFMKKSFIPLLNKIRSYKISTIKGVGFYSMARGGSIIGLAVPAPNIFRIEFIFQDDSSKSEDIFIHKDELQNIVSMVRQRVDKNRL